MYAYFAVVYSLASRTAISMQFLNYASISFSVFKTILLLTLSLNYPFNTHTHMKERIMDDFDPTNPATLSGHLKALELLGQLTARAGPARRYVRAHTAILSVPQIGRAHV